MIAVQTGYVFGTKQPERVARRRPQIDLVAQGNDVVRSVFFMNIRENGFGGQQIGMDIGDERKASIDPPDKDMEWRGLLCYNSGCTFKFLPHVSRETFWRELRALFHVKPSEANR